jgi:4-hydroxy-tetrahydrodipicolinate synthase
MTFTGVYVPLITPFDESGAVALDALSRLAHEILDGGATGLVALGTTGEPASLSAAEQASVVAAITAVCHARGAQLVVGGSGVRAADGVLSLVPPFVRPGEEGVVAHFAAVAGASPAPVIVYHVPVRTGQELSAGALRRLAAIPGVAGVKYATGSLDPAMIDLLADPPPGFAILGGDDVVLSPVLALGAHGSITASAHLRTADFVRLTQAWRAGEVATARTLGGELARLASALFAEPNPTVIKAALHAQGRIPTPAVRLPLLAASTASLSRLPPDSAPAAA